MEERKIGGEGKRDKKGIKVNPKREKDNRRGEERGEKGNLKIKNKREKDHRRGKKER